MATFSLSFWYSLMSPYDFVRPKCFFDKHLFDYDTTRRGECVIDREKKDESGWELPTTVAHWPSLFIGQCPARYTHLLGICTEHPPCPAVEVFPPTYVISSGISQRMLQSRDVSQPKDLFVYNELKYTKTLPPHDGARAGPPLTLCLAHQRMRPKLEVTRCG